MKLFRVMLLPGALMILLFMSCEESLEMPNKKALLDQKNGAYQDDLFDEDDGKGGGQSGTSNAVSSTPVTVSGSNVNYEIWPCSAEDPGNKNPSNLSNFLGWEMAFSFETSQVFVAKATLSGSNITFDDSKVYVTKSTSFDAFTWNKQNPDGTYEDLFPNHYTNWYADVTGGTATYYSPRLTEDEGWMIWTSSGSGIHFRLESHSNKTWDILFDNFNNWYQDDNVSIPIAKYNLTPVTFNMSSMAPEISITGGDVTVEQGQNVTIQWTSSVNNSDKYVVSVPGSQDFITSGTSHTVSFASDGVYNVRVKARKTTVYGSDTSHVYTRSSNKKITVDTPSNTPPVVCTISAPNFVELPVKYDDPIHVSWTASASGGNGGPYTYKWYRIVGSSRTLIDSDNTYGPISYNYSNVSSTLRLEVDAFDKDGNKKTTAKTIPIYAADDIEF